MLYVTYGCCHLPYFGALISLLFSFTLTHNRLLALNFIPAVFFDMFIFRFLLASVMNFSLQTTAQTSFLQIVTVSKAWEK
mgnify:CR=1 FL=1